MKLGLVLAEPPGYSETFFNSKITGLEKEGYKVYLFVGHNKRHNQQFNVVKAWPVFSNNPFLQLPMMLFVLTQLMIRAPKSALKFLQLEKMEGKSFKKRLESLYINAHILAYKVNWLHFGFSTLTLGKENTAKAIGAKMATSFRGFDIGIYPLKHPHVYDLLWTKLDKVHTISDDLYAVALKHGLPRQIPVEKITPAVNYKLFENVDRLQSFHNPISILTVARLHWKKGLEYGLAALHELKKEGFNFSYNIIGEGPELERLIYEVNDLGLDKEVNFLGKKNPKEVAEFMKINDVYLQPSIQEGFCNAVLEAQAAGLICVVSNAEGLAENVLHEKTGFVVPKREVKPLADALRLVFNADEQLLVQIRQQAIARVKTEFDIIDQIKKFKHFYESASNK